MSTEKDEQEFPYAINDLDTVLNSEVLQKFKGIRDGAGGFIQVGPKKWFFPKRYAEDAKFYCNFKTRPDDVFVVTFPRSGTTWTQEMVWLLCNNLDYEKAMEVPLHLRYTFLELSSTNSDQVFETTLGKAVPPGWLTLSNQSDDKRRFIKSHLPLELLPPDLLKSGPKVVYVARNPKDTIVSYYHFARNNPILGFTGGFSEFWNYFKQNLVLWTPYWEHVKEAWNRRNESDNFLFIFYEDLNKDLKGTLAKLATFLGQSYTSEQLDELAEHLKFDNFKNNKSVDAFSAFKVDLKKGENSQFIRKGKVGNWQECFNGKLEKDVDDWTADNLKGSDLKFPILK